MYIITSTIKNWIQLLANNKLMAVVIQSLRFLIERKRILLYGYVLMPNHIHRIYTVNQPFLFSDILRDFHKYTSQQMIKLLRNQNNTYELFRSSRNDRIYQIWQTTHSPKQIESFPFFRQKLEYIHFNPCTDRCNLCEYPEDYLYSSARDYLLNERGVLPVKKIGQ